MAVAAETITTGLIVILLSATAVAMVVGILGLFGEGFERCPRCRHLTLCVEREAHPAGCPATRHERISHVLDSSVRGIHLRHH